MVDYQLYITEYKLNGNSYSGQFFASDDTHAESICRDRGLNEIIIGCNDGRQEILKFLHSVCFASYMAVKGGRMTIDEVLSDEGLIHEIIHIFDGSTPITTIEEINKKIELLNDYTRILPPVTIPFSIINTV